MKNILGAAIIPAIALSLGGCKKEDKGVTFAEYLNQSNQITTSKLNSAVGPLNFEIDG